MKKNNLFVTLLFVSLAALVVLGSSFAMFLKPTTKVTAQAASDAAQLFNSKGEYAVSRVSIVPGMVFNFFGYDWKVVYVNGNVATFWMVNPYTKHVFNEQTNSGAIQTADNTWHNGYTNSTWNGVQLGESSMRTFLADEAKKIIDNSAYKKYKDKVIPGYVPGTNLDNNKAVKTVKKAYYSDDSKDNYCEVPGQTMTVNYGLSVNNVDDRLWLPAVEEVKDGGLWNLTTYDRRWNDTTNSGPYAWLRSANPNFSVMGTLIDYTDEKSSTHFGTLPVAKAYGVRPAIHMNIASASETIGNGNNGGWFTDDMMKVFFIVVCVIGIVGIILVIIAVVRKSRENKQQA